MKVQIAGQEIDVDKITSLTYVQDGFEIELTREKDKPRRLIGFDAPRETPDEDDE